MNKKNTKLNEIRAKRMNREEYGYDFVPELAHALNIDEQGENTKRLEDITKQDKK
jgi:hypothetical protein